MDKRQKGFSLAIVVIILAVLLLLVVGGIFFLTRQTASSSSSPATSVTQVPSTTTTDLAPQLPANQKTAVLVMHADSSYERFIVGDGILQSFIKSLPKGDKVISQTPLGK